MIDQRIGLLFVHGIGEQKRWEHLHSSVLELAELLRRSKEVSSVSINDDTAAWSAAAGDPSFARAPLSMDVRKADGSALRYECYEVWWADLGCRSGPLDTVQFWLWGLGQWCAPIYRELDASKLALPPPEERGPLSQLPKSVVGQPIEIWARLQLFLAAITAAFVFCTWSLAKRVFAALLGQAPSPTIIVQYVGDVRTFTERAAPGDSALSDPGFPRRVGIRRRMVREMVAMASRKDLQGWYVLAHSLGTIVAYNGLTEIGHALPNYLTEDQWDKVPDDWKKDGETGKRQADDLGEMMPSRPPWLEHDHVINRQLLFKKLRGFLTYGSPLDKFAGLWPRIVATATDHDEPFPKGCRWVNLHAPTDPVAGSIDCYDAFHPTLPKPRNCRSRWSIWAGLEHVTYFKGFERFRSQHEGQRIAVGEWLLGHSADDIDQREKGAGAARVAAGIWYILLILLLWAITTSVFVLARSAWDGSASSDDQHFLDWTGFKAAFCQSLGPVAGAFIAPILLVGLYRWARESWLNWKLAGADGLSQAARRMLLRNVVMAVVLIVLVLPLVLVGLPRDIGLAAPWPDGLPGGGVLELVAAGWTVAAVSVAGILLASTAQATLNATDRQRRLRPAT